MPVHFNQISNSSFGCVGTFTPCHLNSERDFGYVELASILLLYFATER